MADLGDIGQLVDCAFVYPLARNIWSLNRAKNPVRAIYTEDLPFTASDQQDFCRLAGGISDSNNLPLKRTVRVLQRDNSHLVAVSESLLDGQFSIETPTNMTLDVHVMAVDGDGCDAYLKCRTPVCG